MLDYVENAHRGHTLECLDAIGAVDPANGPVRTAPEPREPCGALSADLWRRADAEVETLLRAANGTASSGALDGSLFADVDCTTLPDDRFGRALHVASRAPRWVSPAFLECAARREMELEGEPLWAILDAAAAHPEARDWSFLRGAVYDDVRTTRRLARALDGVRPGRLRSPGVSGEEEREP